MSIGIYLLLAVLLVLLNGFFVAAEFALVKVRSTRIMELANAGNPAARMTLRSLQHLDAYLSATQLGITFTSIGLGWVGEPAIARLLEPMFHAAHLPEKIIHPASFAIAFAVVSAAHIVIGELAPKSWAIQQPERVSMAVAYPLHAFYVTFRYAISFLNWLASLVLRLFRIKPGAEHEMAHTQEELRMILTASGQSGVLKDSEVDLVKHVFEFADKVASEVMVPRVDMVYLDVTWPIEKNLDVVRSHTYTRYPLCNGEPDTVIGMIHLKDIVRQPRSSADLSQLKRDILFIPETKSIDQLLREFQVRKMHMAVVVDEYGGTAGIVTMEDVLEQIVGEIHDEHEEPDPEVKPLQDGRYLVDGRALLSDLRLDHEIFLTANGSETVGGWVLDHVGAIPAEGLQLDVDGYQVRVEAMDGQRVRKVMLVKTEVEEALPVTLAA